MSRRDFWTGPGRASGRINLVNIPRYIPPLGSAYAYVAERVEVEPFMLCEGRRIGQVRYRYNIY